MQGGREQHSSTRVGVRPSRYPPHRQTAGAHLPRRGRPGATARRHAQGGACGNARSHGHRAARVGHALVDPTADVHRRSRQGVHGDHPPRRGDLHRRRRR
ncbi:hypothetical protein PLANTIT3_70150 [Plantibacter sp. T3]|nr:hypothetical protein PLANTIT3_70150 [Plantibacter sp. T3]